MDTNGIEYVLWWLEVAKKEIEADTKSTLSHHTDVNYSGDVSGWGDWIVKIYYRPETLEEWFLRGEVHKVLLVAIQRAIARVNNLDPAMSRIFQIELDLARLFLLLNRVKRIDPLSSPRNKVFLDKLCKKYLNKTLRVELEEEGFNCLCGMADFVW